MGSKHRMRAQLSHDPPTRALTKCTATAVACYRNCGKKSKPTTLSAKRPRPALPFCRNCGKNVPATWSAKRSPCPASATAEVITRDAAATASSPTNATSPSHARRSMASSLGLRWRAAGWCPLASLLSLSWSPADLFATANFPRACRSIFFDVLPSFEAIGGRCCW